MDTDEIEKRDFDLLLRLSKKTGNMEASQVVRSRKNKVLLWTVVVLFIAILTYMNTGTVPPSSSDNKTSTVAVKEKAGSSKMSPTSPVTDINYTVDDEPIDYKTLEMTESSHPSIEQKKQEIQQSESLSPKNTVSPTKPDISAPPESLTLFPKGDKTEPTQSAKSVDRDLYVADIALCEEVSAKNPSGRQNTFSLQKDRKAVVWTDVRSKSVPTKIKHIYYLENKKYFELSLDVLYPRTRTWSKITLRNKQQIGSWRVEVLDEEGHVLEKTGFTVIL